MASYHFGGLHSELPAVGTCISDFMYGHLLLSIDDPRLRQRLKRGLTASGLSLETVERLGAEWPRLAQSGGDVFLVSRRRIPEPVADTLASFRALPDAPEVVVLDAGRDPEDRARLVAAGCAMVLDAKLSTSSLCDVLGAILQRRRAKIDSAPGARRTSGAPRLSDFITTSPAMQTFMGLVYRVVASDTSLLILGETGVGKEHLARAIHAESPRASGPFVAMNCGAIAESLLESELFGHEEGAFTGATRARRGSFELAHRGVVFLDEIGDLPAHLQVKLLHVLQRREIQRLGSEKPVPIDVRVMAATNRDIASEVDQRRFRPDLYYRLGVVTLAIPPLRERPEDIGVLVESYLDDFRQTIRRDVAGIDPAALEALRGYDWPGNVRELVNVLERAMLLATTERIRLEDLPESIRATRSVVRTGVAGASALASTNVLSSVWLRRTLSEARSAVLADFEKNYLDGLLRDCGGRIGETARRAGIEPRSLYEKMKRHGLAKEEFRAGRKPEGAKE